MIHHHPQTSLRIPAPDHLPTRTGPSNLSVFRTPAPAHQAVFHSSALLNGSHAAAPAHHSPRLPSFTVSVRSIPASGGLVAVSVGAPPGRGWMVERGAAWLHNHGGSAGHGPGTVLLNAQPNNTGAPRTATIRLLLPAETNEIPGHSAVAAGVFATQASATQPAQ
jgi:hypothetical protein